jgi:hypothetical protein
MSANIALFIILIISLEAMAAAKGQGENTSDNNLPYILPLCGEWDFTYTAGHANDPPPEQSFAAKMPVPGCWDDNLDRLRTQAFWSKEPRFNAARPIEFPMGGEEPPDAGLPYLLGCGWYRRNLEIPEGWRNRQITLYVGRVVMEAWVYVNRKEVYHHFGHSTTWEAPLTKHLNFGQNNEIIIAVDNTSQERIGCIIRGYEGRSSGIFGPVTLKASGSTRIFDTHIRPDSDKLFWRVDLEGTRPTDSQLRWKVIDSDNGEEQGRGQEIISDSNVQWTTGTLNMQPWSDRQPKLYDITVELWSGATRLDTCHRRFGLRRLTRDGFMLRLNGKPIFLRGLCECSYYEETCTPPVTKDWYVRRIRRLKELGFNWLRFHTTVPLEPYLEAADELGMLVQVEPPLGFQKAEWVDILRFCRKHPSVVIYCCGNEEILDEEKIEYLRQCASAMRDMVPDALFNPQEALRGVEYGSHLSWFGKGLVKEPYPHNPERLEKLKSFSDMFGQYAWGTLSYHTLTGDPKSYDKLLEIYERPCLTHEVGIIGCYINLDLEHRYVGSRFGTDIFASVRRNLDKAGLLSRAALYYRNSSAWQRLLRKDVIETARKTQHLAGYDLLGATDVPYLLTGYNCGIMNEFGELKPGDSVTDILGYNGQSVLLLDEQRQRNLLTGQSYENNLLVSWFGDEPLKHTRAFWHLKSANGEILLRGQEPVQPVEAGQVKEIAKIRFTVPQFKKPLKTQLVVRLSGPQCELSNHWDYWLFPPAEAKIPENVSVVSNLNTQELQSLIQGSRIVLLGSKPLPVREMSFQMGRAGRADENLATVIAKHPLINRFPQDGYCDWQFFPMFGRRFQGMAAGVVFDNMPELFDPIIEVVSSYKIIRKQACLFEWRVGKGKLLVCSFKLPDSDPGAAWLRQCILEYAASDQFDPHITVSPEKLARLMNIAPPAGEKEESSLEEEGYDWRGQTIIKQK